MDKRNYYAKLTTSLHKYGITMQEHKSSPAYLFMRDPKYREFWYHKREFDEEFMWYNQPTSFRQMSEDFPEIHLIITREHPEWICK